MAETGLASAASCLLHGTPVSPTPPQYTVDARYMQPMVPRSDATSQAEGGRRGWEDDKVEVFSVTAPLESNRTMDIFNNQSSSSTKTKKV